MNHRRVLIGLATLGLCLVLNPVSGGATETTLHPSGVLMPQKIGVSPPLASLPTIEPGAEAPKTEPREINAGNRELPGMLLDATPPSKAVDTRVQDRLAPNALPAPIIDFAGVGNVNGVLPPDTNGDVGVNYYVQWVNLSYAVFNTSDGTVAAGPFNGNTLWTGFGGSCENSNDGDPIVLYDQLAGRWFMSQFTGDNRWMGSATVMRARLGFAITTDIQPDILLLDEIMSVGDKEFRTKRTERIRGFQESETTVVLVSHGLATVRSLCNRCMWIDHGAVKTIGPTEEVVQEYLQHTGTAEGPSPAQENNGEPGQSA